MKSKKSRRNFLKETALLGAGLGLVPHAGFSKAATPVYDQESLYLHGPQKGYSLHVGTLLSTMTMMRTWLLRTVSDLTEEQLDYQIDDQSNSIGAMLMHLAATERYYQLNTFEDMSWGSWGKEIKDEWDVAMDLGPKARKTIRGHNISYYVNKLHEVREITEREFAKRDDVWVMKSEPFFDNKPTNNYCKWFHVCEHESNHNGQIKFIKKRLPV